MNEFTFTINGYTANLDYYDDELTADVVHERLMDWALAKMDNEDADAEEMLSLVENEEYTWGS